MNLLKEYQDIFTWHKRELGTYSLGEHTFDTHGFPPCRMTPSRLSFWEETRVNKQIQALVKLGKMRKNMSKYECCVTLPVNKMVAKGFADFTKL